VSLGAGLLSLSALSVPHGAGVSLIGLSVPLIGLLAGLVPACLPLLVWNLAVPGHICPTTIRYPGIHVVDDAGEVVDYYLHTARDRL
jgi:hypothetical protein